MLAILIVCFTYVTCGIAIQHIAWLAVQTHHGETTGIKQLPLSSNWWYVIRACLAWSWPFVLVAFMAIRAAVQKREIDE